MEARRRSVARRLVILCLVSLVVAAALAGAEILARRVVPHVSRQGATTPLEALEVGAHLLVRYDERGRRFLPGARVVIRNSWLSHEDVELEINSRGLRDRELPPERRPGELRLLALGDSITAVDYLPVEQGWVEQLEGLLAPLWPDGPVEVVNAGLGNVGLAEELAILEEVGLGLRPQVVLLAFYLNDGNPAWGFSARVAEPGILRRYSVLADLVTTRLLLWRWKGEQAGGAFSWIRAQEELAWRSERAALLELAEMASWDWGAAWKEPAWRRVDEGLERLARLAGENGFRVVVVAFPVSFQVLADYLEDAPQRRLEDAARRRGFGFLDLLPLLREHRQETLFFDQCHLVPGANARVAAALAGFLARESLPALAPAQRSPTPPGGASPHSGSP